MNCADSGFRNFITSPVKDPSYFFCAQAFLWQKSASTMSVANGDIQQGTVKWKLYFALQSSPFKGSTTQEELRCNFNIRQCVVLHLQQQHYFNFQMFMHDVVVQNNTSSL